MPDRYPKAYHGMVFTANSNGIAQTSRSFGPTSINCNNNFYGYELKTNSNRFYSSFVDSDYFKIKEVLINSFSLTDSTVHLSKDKNFIKNIAVCSGSVYTILDNVVYKTNDDIFFYPKNEEFDEIKNYIPAGNVVHEIAQELFSPIIINGMFLINRRFTVKYGINQTREINKWSRIEDEKTLDTPTLFIKNNGSLQDAPLYLKTSELSKNDVPLTLYGAVYSSSGFNIHIESENRSVLPLVMKTLDPEIDSATTTLNVYGSTSSLTSYKNQETTLYINCVERSDENSMPLNLLAPNISDASSQAPLTLINQTQKIQDVLSIFIQNDQLSTKETMPLLTVAVIGNTSGSANLVLRRKGASGGQEIEKGIGLSMGNKHQFETISLYTNAITGLQNSCTLVIPKPFELPENNTSLNMFGYSE